MRELSLLAKYHVHGVVMSLSRRRGINSFASRPVGSIPNARSITPSLVLAIAPDGAELQHSSNTICKKGGRKPPLSVSKPLVRRYAREDSNL